MAISMEMIQFNDFDDHISISSSNPTSPDGSSLSKYGDSSSDFPQHISKTTEDTRQKSGGNVSPKYSVFTKSNKDKRKETNRIASIRYRRKKKIEVDEVLGEEHYLRSRRGELKSRIVVLERDIMHFKGLVHDLFKMKGFSRP